MIGLFLFIETIFSLLQGFQQFDFQAAL